MRIQWLMRRVAVLGWLLPLSASAQVDTKDYRRADRKLPESPQRFAFELRMGPYRPRIDEEFKGKTPFADTFGSGQGFHLGAELDWQVVRIPYVGSLGPGFSWAYTSRSAKAKISGSQVESAEETKLTIMPMSLVGVLRVDVLTRELGVPLVPYGKAGLGLGLWSVSTEKGVVTRDGVQGRGRSWGTHLALGGMLHLDFLEPDTALAFDDEMGVNNTYLFFEWMWSDLGSSSMIEKRPQMRVGTSGWVLGLALEF
ncbi:MAG: MXAN_2562 family outer membrane beta-barrel protein [Myxococcales bacterium]|nr:MXAN_2562 family outer membrane beta-barrel protein [Polyangiaceae bacterium]MDW8248389.1 MXAN_2562 family outer membrane beta-barrel protein [Myxococcales bacterium]